MCPKLAPRDNVTLCASVPDSRTHEFRTCGVEWSMEHAGFATEVLAAPSISFTKAQTDNTILYW